MNGLGFWFQARKNSSMACFKSGTLTKLPRRIAFSVNSLKPTLHQVQPTGTGRNKVADEPRMLLQPRLHVRLFVRPVVVHDQVQLQPRGKLTVQAAQKFQPLLMAMPARGIHRSPCRPTRSAPQTTWWCRCACSRASSCRTGLSSAAAPAASDPRLGSGSSHPNTAPAPCPAGSNTTPPHRSASPGISHPARA